MVDAKDAEALQVPICFLPSKDEPADACRAFQEAVQANQRAAEKAVYQRFETVQHGFLAAVSFFVIRFFFSDNFRTECTRQCTDILTTRACR